MRILVFDSHYKTNQYHEVIRDCISGFVFVNRGLLKEFVRKNKSSEIPILDLSDQAFDIWYKKQTSLLEHRVNKWKYEFDDLFHLSLINIIGGDRRLSQIKISNAFFYLFFIYESMIEFLESHRFSHCLMEPTWGHEILSCMIFEKRDVTVFQIQKCKLRPNHFYLFKGMYDLEFFRNEITKPERLELVSGDISSEKIKGFIRDSRRNSSLNWLFSGLIRVIREKILGQHNRFIHESVTGSVIRKIINVFRYHMITANPARFGFVSGCQTAQFIYFPLHYEPEAAILINGRGFRDQIGTLVWLRELIPADIVLVVKEHPHCIGNRPISFYQKIREIKGVVLLDSRINSRQLISESRGVVAIAGTAVLEAYLLGKPGFCLAPMYFSNVWPWHGQPYRHQIVQMLAMNGSFYADSKLIKEVEQGGFLGDPDDELLSDSSASLENTTLMRSQIVPTLRG